MLSLIVHVNLKKLMVLVSIKIIHTAWSVSMSQRICYCIEDVN